MTVKKGGLLEMKNTVTYLAADWIRLSLSLSEISEENNETSEE